MQRRRRFKQTETLEQRLAQQAARLRLQASEIEPGPERDKINRLARQAETVSHVSEWLASHDLQPPK